jgi:hypothetical protein
MGKLPIGARLSLFNRVKMNRPATRAGRLGSSGADNGIRTRDPHLGKVMLYQLSHVRARMYSIKHFKKCKQKTALWAKSAQFRYRIGRKIALQQLFSRRLGLFVILVFDMGVESAKLSSARQRA